MKKLITILIIGMILLTGCSDSTGPESDTEATFSMQVFPVNMDDTIPWQRCVFLVSVENEDPERDKGKPVTISASVPGAEIIVENPEILPGQVAEVIVIPEEISTGKKSDYYSQQVDERDIVSDEEPEEVTLEGTICGERDGKKKEEPITIKVIEGTDFLYETAIKMRDRFIPWLAANYPELGITDETQWVRTIVKPHIFVVAFYLFFSEEWEMGVSWHVTTEPHDWARIYLRRRFVDENLSHAFEISSWSSQDEEPHPINPEETVGMSTVYR